MANQINLKRLRAGVKISARVGIVKLDEGIANNGKNYWRLKIVHPSGEINGIVWADDMAVVQVVEGGVVDLEATTQSYKDVISLTIHKATPVPDVLLKSMIPQIPTVIIDPIYCPHNPQLIPPVILDSIQSINHEPPVDRATPDNWHYYPPLCQLQAIGLINPHTKKGMIIGISAKKIKSPSDQITYEAVAKESILIAKLWEILSGYDRVVSLQGKRRTSSFLNFRTLANQLNVPFKIDKKLTDYSTPIRDYQLTTMPFELMAVSFGVCSESEIISDQQVRSMLVKPIGSKAVAAMHQRLQLMVKTYEFYRDHANCLVN